MSIHTRYFRNTTHLTAVTRNDTMHQGYTRLHTSQLSHWIISPSSR